MNLVGLCPRKIEFQPKSPLEQSHDLCPGGTCTLGNARKALDSNHRHSVGLMVDVLMILAW